MNVLSFPTLTITQSYVEPPVTDIGKKAREIMSTKKWEQPSTFEQVFVPGRIFREVLEKVGITNLEKVSDGIPMIQTIDESPHISEDEAATELFQSLTYNIENKVYAAAKQVYGSLIVKMLQGKNLSYKTATKCDYDIYYKIREKLKIFFESRGLEFKEKYSSLQGGSPKVWVAIRWSDARDQQKTFMTDFIFEKE